MSPADTAPGLLGQPLPIARYRLEALPERPLRLPPYSGSLLRGAFGAALRRSACMTGLPACAGCPLQATCPYPAIFEHPQRATPLPQRFAQVPNPYVVEPPADEVRRIEPGHRLSWHMVLVGTPALRQLALIVHAWQRALAHGLGHDRVPCRLAAVLWCGEDGDAHPVLDPAQDRVLPHDAALEIPPAPLDARGLDLLVQTPLRLQHQGRALPAQELDLRTLLLAALRRATLMLHLHAGVALDDSAAALLEAAAGLVDDRRGLRWRDWTRYSARQRQEMTLGGVVGRWRIRGDVRAAWPWLWLGQWLHLGKNATMGLGAYRLEVVR